MNPDNPNFRTPEEEARAAELVRLRAEVVLASDFDRIMSERDELWKRATKFVMPGEMDTGESIEHYIKTLEQTVAELKAGTANALKRVFNRQIGFLVSANAFRVLCEEIEKYDPFFKMPNSSERRRFVADRNAEMQNLKETIARQAKVIEKLKDVVTCVGCAVNESCPYAWDGYNTNGDCLAEK